MVAHAPRLTESIDDKASIEIRDEMARLTLAIVVQTLLGADVTGEAKGVGRLMIAVLDAANDRAHDVPAYLYMG